MRLSHGVCLVMLAVGCAHSTEQLAQQSVPKPVESAEELSARASKAKDAQDFTTCAQQFRLSAEADTDEYSRADSFYSAARCAALAGEPSKGMELLKSAVQHGYYEPERLQYDPELSSLQKLAGWDEVIASAKANLAKAPNPPIPVGVLGGIDAFGSRRADSESVRRLLGFELGKTFVPSQVLFRQKEEELRKHFNLAFAHISLVFFFAGEDGGKHYMTVDLVDAEDAQRLRFLPAPSGHPEDPEGLVALRMAYDDQAEKLFRQGAINMETQATCRVANCFFGFGHPDLAHYEPVFVEKVPKHEEALVRVLREEADEEKRAAAAFVLAYATTPEKAVKLLAPFIRDPAGGVRNNVLRVIVANQEEANHPLVELATVLDALSMPANSDRNKACYLLNYLLEDMKPEELKAQRAPLIRQLGQQLVTMASMAQPNNREPAVFVLQQLSGENYEAPEQWKAWLSRQPK